MLRMIWKTNTVISMIGMEIVTMGITWRICIPIVTTLENLNIL